MLSPPAPGVARSALRQRLLLPGLMMLTTVTGVVGSLGAPLIPEIARAEGVSLATAQWCLTATLLAGAVLSPIVGRLGAGRRRRPVMLLALTGVAIGTLLCALPLGIVGLLVGRSLQGLAFSVTPLSFAVAREVLPPERQASALSGLSVVNVVSAGLGFPVSAFLAEWVGLDGAFWFATLLAGLAFVAALLAVPRSDDPATGRVDLPGAFLLGGGTLALLLVITQGERWGYLSPPTLVLLGLAVVLLGCCVRWLLRARHPLLDLRLATGPGVVSAHVATVVAGCGMYMMMSLVMILVQGDPAEGYGLGRSVAVAGLMLTPYAVSSMIGNRLGLWLGPRIGPDLLLPLGCLMFGLANLFMVFRHGTTWELVTVMFVGGVGSGMTFNSIPWLLIRYVPAAETGSVMSINVVMRFLGFSTGSAVALAMLQAFADDGRVTQAGFVAGAATACGVCLVAAVVCLGLARAALRRPAHDGVAQEVG